MQTQPKYQSEVTTVVMGERTIQRRARDTLENLKIFTSHYIIVKDILKLCIILNFISIILRKYFDSLKGKE